MTTYQLSSIAQSLVHTGKGILAAYERNGSMIRNVHVRNGRSADKCYFKAA
jgi:fructose-bisphosphate aldolase class 1